jgi:hypothetical protein
MFRSVVRWCQSCGSPGSFVKSNPFPFLMTWRAKNWAGSPATFVRRRNLSDTVRRDDCVSVHERTANIPVYSCMDSIKKKERERYIMVLHVTIGRRAKENGSDAGWRRRQKGYMFQSGDITVLSLLPPDFLSIISVPFPGPRGNFQSALVIQVLSNRTE